MSSGVARALCRIHRLEYPLPIHYLCYASWGACYAVTDFAQLLSLPVLLVVLANLIHPVSMNALNAAVDLATDARNRRKRELARAAVRLGPARVVALAIAEMTLCLALCGVAALLLGGVLPIATMAAIIALHLSYNLEPIHLKRRGLANPFALGVSFGFLPCVLSHAAVTGTFGTPFWLIYSGLGLSVTARALWWMVPDRDADGAAATVTAAVRHGAARMARLSCVLALGVPALLGWGLWQAYGPGWAVTGTVVASAWFFGQLASLRTITARSYAELRRLFMTPMMLANVVFALIPLAAK